MNNTSLRLDEGAVMSSLKHAKDDSGLKIEFNYFDLTTDLDGRASAVSIPIASHLLSFVENTMILESVLALEVPGTKLAQDATGLWRLTKLAA